MDTTAQNDQPAAGLLLGALNSDQADLLGQKFRIAYTTVSILKHAAEHRSAAWNSLDALWEDLFDLTADAIAAGSAANEREFGADAMAQARCHNRLTDIAKAEQLLAAERTAGAAA